ncbi:MAG: ABC transporter permease [Myxococcota bacterium]
MRGLLDLLRQTASSMRAHALRFALTTLGIFWGATMLVYLSAAALGMETNFSDSLERTGPKNVWGFTGAVIKEHAGERGARPLTLELEDVERLEALDLVEAATSETQLRNVLVRSEFGSRLLSVMGMDEDGLEIRRFEMEHGRVFRRLEAESGARVAVLGAESAARLFDRRPPVGAWIRLNGVPFRVIGVARRKGDQLVNMGPRDDNLVVVPTQAAFRWLDRGATVRRFVATPRHRDESSESIRAMRSVTALHHGFQPDSEIALDFVDIKEVWNILDALFTGLKAFLISASVVTLLVGSVGVMNIMLVVVGERVQEIGLRKALGAKDKAIFALFLAESVAISLMAGLLGGATGIGLVRLTQLAADHGEFGLVRPVVDWTLVGVGLSVLGAVAVIAGTIPALRAARTSPSESLRSV